MTVSKAPVFKSIAAGFCFSLLAFGASMTGLAGAAQASLVVHYSFDGGDATDSSGNGYDGNVNGANFLATGGFDGGGAYEFSIGQMITGAASASQGTGIDLTAGGNNTAAFYMKWDGSLSPSQMPFIWGSAYDLFISGGNFGFNTFASGDLLGINDDILDDQWVHVAAVFNNGDGTTNELFINGVSQVLSEKAGAHFTPLRHAKLYYRRGLRFQRHHR